MLIPTLIKYIKYLPVLVDAIEKNRIYENEYKNVKKRK